MSKQCSRRDFEEDLVNVDSYSGAEIERFSDALNDYFDTTKKLDMMKSEEIESLRKQIADLKVQVAKITQERDDLKSQNMKLQKAYYLAWQS